LTAAKFKPFTYISCVGPRLVQYCKHFHFHGFVWLLLVVTATIWVLCYDRRSIGQSVLESVAYNQIFITVRQLLIFLCGALSLTRGRVCRSQLLLALASADISGSESHGTRDHILLSQIRDFPFCRLVRLAGLRWRYSTPPPLTGIAYSISTRVV
jgi:hypothetical protein